MSFPQRINNIKAGGQFIYAFIDLTNNYFAFAVTALGTGTTENKVVPRELTT